MPQKATQIIFYWKTSTKTRLCLGEALGTSTDGGSELSWAWCWALLELHFTPRPDSLLSCSVYCLHPNDIKTGVETAKIELQECLAGGRGEITQALVITDYYIFSAAEGNLWSMFTIISKFYKYCFIIDFVPWIQCRWKYSPFPLPMADQHSCSAWPLCSSRICRNETSMD